MKLEEDYKTIAKIVSRASAKQQQDLGNLTRQLKFLTEFTRENL